MQNQSQKKITRYFGISNWAVNNYKTVFVLTVLLVIIGFSSYVTIPKELFPEIKIPTIYVGTAYPGYSPEDIEKLITRPIEKEIKSISGIDKIKSISQQGYSTILVEFKFDVTTEEALRKVKDAVDKAKADKDFPKDLPADPNVFELNFSDFPILNINLSGDFSQEELKRYAEQLQDEIEYLPEISSADIRGINEKEVKVELDLPKMEAVQVSFNDVENAIKSENVSISGGEILIDGMRRTLRVDGSINDYRDLANIIVKREKGNIVYLKDIANVKFEEEEATSFARQFGKPVVSLDVVKRSGENLIEAVDKILAIIDKAKKSYLPGNLQITITNDQSKRTRSQIDNLENSIISGMILVIVVLLFFLGLRNAFFVGVAIPISMLISFAVLNFMGVTMSIIVLFSLILALGMLVDNGIVVIENIYRLRSEEGLSLKEAAKQGTGEVAWPIISSTATTLAAFVPLAFWPGMIGEFMKYLPVTLIIVLSSSLFVGLVINPALASRFMKDKENDPEKKKVIKRVAIMAGFALLFLLFGWKSATNLLIILAVIDLFYSLWFYKRVKKFQYNFLPRLENAYARFLGFALRKKNPRYFFFGTIFLLLFSFFLLAKFTPKVLFFPENEPQFFNVFVELPIGTDITVTDKYTREVEKRVYDVIKKYEEDTVIDGKKVKHNFLIESVIAKVGKGTSDPSDGPQMSATPHKARVTVSFVDFEKRRGISSSKVMEDVRKALVGIPGVRIIVEKNRMGPPRKKPINIEISGDNYDSLIVTSERLRSFIESKKIAGIEKLKSNIEVLVPELLVDIDREKARRFNLSTAQIGQALRTSLYGMEVSTYKIDEDDYPIQIRLSDEYRYNPQLLLNQNITFRDQSNGQIRQVPLSAVVSTIKRSTYSAVNRINLTRVITISSNVLEGYNPNEVVNNIKKEVFSEFNAPDGITMKFTGEQEDQAKEMAFLSKALMIAVFLIFLIIVAQFNSVSTPIIITTSVLFSLIGVLLGLVIFQMDFVIIMTMIGIISLAGVVVNNAIVLIDFANLEISRRKAELEMDEDDQLPLSELAKVLVKAGKLRLRPVLLTAITTVLGLVPLATGMNINFFTLVSDWDPQIWFGGDNVAFWGPMSWTVIFGLTFATFLTLVIVPVMLYLLYKIKYRFSKNNGSNGIQRNAVKEELFELNS